jgi:hypothetical protein
MKVAIEVPTLVVHVHISFSSTLRQYRVHTSVQTLVGGQTIYERDGALEGTWAEVIGFLTGLLSTTDALETAESHYVLLQGL